MYKTKRARDLAPGDVVYYVTKPCPTVAEVKPDIKNSQFYPHRPYKIVRVRWEGQSEFNWSTGASSWVAVIAK